MNSKSIKILIIISIVFAIISLSLSVFALEPSNVSINDNVDGGVTDVAGKVLGFIQVIGVIVSVGILMILGIKYMMGSAEEKAEYKKVFIPYIIGAILLFSATTIANAVYNAIKPDVNNNNGQTYSSGGQQMM